MTDVIANPRVPARLVLLSLAALWVCYFLVATLRGAFMGFDLAWPIISRRLTICILSMLVMAAVWPLLQMIDRKSGGMRLVIVLIGALPLALLLSVINDTVFADIEMSHAYGDEEDAAAIKAGNVRISRDEAGNILVDLPKVPPPPAPPPVPPSGSAEETPPAVPEVGREPAQTGSAITIRTGKTMGQSYARWAAIADTAFGRYFLVLAWAALYFALAKAEQARAAERREGEYRRAAEAAELRSLRYQVNPHFLFNTLNSLSALVMTGRQDDAETMIQTLSTFYRHTLSGDPTSDLRLVDEIELQKLYFAIEAVRFPNRLLTKIDVDPAAVDAMVPGMILQPLVENSVKYAVAASREPVTVTIKARREGGQLVITVSDDGPGTERGKAEGCGIGLANVRDRLHARYGRAGTLAFGKRPEGGFETVLRMPLELGRA
ncbi:Histidine kinase-, DNA gyrase B-, and HSP90-like ATPase [Novosphingobium sp. CF614]|uniref:sensor histidine kinase n=1 Tax=Novosphingobium sp. CF614 TaxID=1884364 RepID=UPI0008EE04CC|nr:histidine kinase [Novosphingobium sp. CF614]SFG22959.1 Histidine kinase-, DNA gyrase B-, and HSP90-like ATPase [Novosphingobium sp. CF614]